MPRLAFLLVPMGIIAMPIQSQTPPPLLQIVIEKLHPGVEKDYGSIEEELRSACARLGAPNRYLALVSTNRPTEVWWLNMYDSQSAVDRVAEAYAANTALMRALRELSAKKTGMTEPPVDLMTEFRGDLSNPEAWRIGELPYAVVKEIQAPARSPGAVFQEPDGRAFAWTAASDQNSAERRAGRLGKGARILRVEPKWSLPQEAWVIANPVLWDKP